MTNTQLKDLAEHLGYEMTDWDVEQFKNDYFHIIVSGNLKWVINAIRNYFE